MRIIVVFVFLCVATQVYCITNSACPGANNTCADISGRNCLYGQCSNGQCQVLNVVADGQPCNNAQCGRNSYCDYYSNNVNPVCKRRVPSGYYCNYDDDCTTRQCHVNDHRCFLPRYAGESCENDYECLTGTCGDDNVCTGLGSGDTCFPSESAPYPCGKGYYCDNDSGGNCVAQKAVGAACSLENIDNGFAPVCAGPRFCGGLDENREGTCKNVFSTINGGTCTEDFTCKLGSVCSGGHCASLGNTSPCDTNSQDDICPLAFDCAGCSGATAVCKQSVNFNCGIYIDAYLSCAVDQGCPLEAILGDNAFISAAYEGSCLTPCFKEARDTVCCLGTGYPDFLTDEVKAKFYCDGRPSACSSNNKPCFEDRDCVYGACSYSTFTCVAVQQTLGEGDDCYDTAPGVRCEDPLQCIDGECTKLKGTNAFCAFDNECVTKFCNKAISKCDVARFAGDACTMDDHCYSQNCDNNICVGLEEGESCSGVGAPFPCAKGLYCSPDSGECETAKTEGQSCALDLEGFSFLNCEAPLFCGKTDEDGIGTCIQPFSLDVGDTCSNGNLDEGFTKEIFCKMGLDCTSEGTCRSIVAGTTECDTTEIPDGNSCGLAGDCNSCKSNSAVCGENLRSSCTSQINDLLTCMGTNQCPFFGLVGDGGFYYFNTQGTCGYNCASQAKAVGCCLSNYGEYPDPKLPYTCESFTTGAGGGSSQNDESADANSIQIQWAIMFICVAFIMLLQRN